MTTKFIGMKEFRQNIASFAHEAKMKDIHFIVLRKNVPILEIRPIDEKQFAFEKLAGEIKKSRLQAKKGKVYTQAQIMKELGIL